MKKKKKGAPFVISGYILTIISIFNYALGDIERAKVLILGMGVLGIVLIIIGTIINNKF